MSSPSEIWLEPVDHEADPDMGRSWCVHPLDCDECGAESVRYVRADIPEARIKELEAARDSWRRVCEPLAREKLKVENENLGLTEALVELEAENAELRAHVDSLRQSLLGYLPPSILEADDEGEA